MQQTGVDGKEDGASVAELTLRGLVLGALITVVFTAANIYLGLKIGLTFSSSIPAAVISMAVLRLLGGGTILENNMVQTQASAAGTLSSIIFILPALVLVGTWHGFPFWQTAGVCAAGGVLGVIFTIPLRRAMVVNSSLPYPEGVAAAEILRVGEAAGTGPAAAAATSGAEPGAAEILFGGVVAAVISFATSGLHLLADEADLWFAAGPATFRLSTGFSAAMLGAGYLVGIAVGIANLIGYLIAWGVAVPVLTALHPAPAGADIAEYATGLWASKVRFMGAGTIGIAAVWALVGLLRPTIEGVRQSLRGASLSAGGGLPRTERDLPPVAIVLLFAVAVLAMAATFVPFLSGLPAIAAAGIWGFLAYGLVFAVVFGFLVAAACGFMAGLIGASSSPISGIGILSTISASVLLLPVMGAGGLLHGAAGQQAAVALVLFTTSFVLATATISNDNLQDLKTGHLVGATPAAQQWALLAGCLVGAAVIPPILDMLYAAYGFPGALPRPGMDPGQALAAPQATLMAAIATGIFQHRLDWTMVLVGIGLGLALLLLDTALKRRTARLHLPVLAVGIGIYLPPAVTVTLSLGALLGWLLDFRLRRRPDPEQERRRGVLIASGLIVGESLVGVAMAGIIGASGNQAPLALVGPGFAPAATWLGLAAFLAMAAAFAWRLLRRA